MKNVFILLGLWFWVPVLAHCQYIRAGFHDASCYYHNVEPDSTVTGRNNHETNFPAARYYLDINGDLVDDLYLYSLGSWSNGAGYSELSVRIAEGGTGQIALGYIDTCHLPNNGTRLFAMAKSLRSGDTIDSRLEWSSSKLFLTYTTWVVQTYSCFNNGFENDPAGNYLAARLVQPEDTLYGWIQLTDVNFLTFTIQEFAFEKSSLGISEDLGSVRVYPVPARDYVIIEGMSGGSQLEVLSANGSCVISQPLDQGKSRIDMAKFPDGLYLFMIRCHQSTLIRKVAKSHPY